MGMVGLWPVPTSRTVAFSTTPPAAVIHSANFGTNGRRSAGSPDSPPNRFWIAL
jgi:hypothetical protein